VMRAPLSVSSRSHEGQTHCTDARNPWPALLHPPVTPIPPIPASFSSSAGRASHRVSKFQG
jgi:hypothetical protein